MIVPPSFAATAQQLLHPLNDIAPPAVVQKTATGPPDCGVAAEPAMIPLSLMPFADAYVSDGSKMSSLKAPLLC
jgi:hypothetical protein